MDLTGQSTAQLNSRQRKKGYRRSSQQRRNSTGQEGEEGLQRKKRERKRRTAQDPKPATNSEDGTSLSKKEKEELQRESSGAAEAHGILAARPGGKLTRKARRTECFQSTCRARERGAAKRSSGAARNTGSEGSRSTWILADRRKRKRSCKEKQRGSRSTWDTGSEARWEANAQGAKD
nr:UPF0329 protein ECU05_1680/ECU11_0050-like [Coffea arabica]